MLKKFLLWLLIAALPLQGFAAAMQTSCGQMVAHHGQTEKTSAMQAHHQAAGDTADSMHASADHNAPHFAKDPAGANHHGGSCSACASCCIGAAAPPSVNVLTPVYRSAVPAPSAPAHLVAGFIPAGLERPPKRFTA